MSRIDRERRRPSRFRVMSNKRHSRRAFRIRTGGWRRIRPCPFLCTEKPGGNRTIRTSMAPTASVFSFSGSRSLAFSTVRQVETARFLVLIISDGNHLFVGLDCAALVLGNVIASAGRQEQRIHRLHPSCGNAQRHVSEHVAIDNAKSSRRCSFSVEALRYDSRSGITQTTTVPGRKSDCCP